MTEGKTRQYFSRDNVYAYFRIAPEETVFVYLNNNGEPRQIPWEAYSEVTGNIKVQGRNVITGETFDPSVPVPAKSSVVIEFK